MILRIVEYPKHEYQTINLGSLGSIYNYGKHEVVINNRFEFKLEQYDPQIKTNITDEIILFKQTDSPRDVIIDDIKFYDAFSTTITIKNSEGVILYDMQCSKVQHINTIESTEDFLKWLTQKA